MFAVMRTEVYIMLKEKVFYKDGIPVKILVANIREYPIHFHDDPEIAYVLAGTVRLKKGGYTYALKQGDIFVINGKEFHSYHSAGEDNIVMLLQMDVSFFSGYYDDFKNCFFSTGMTAENDERLEILRDLSARIMMETLQAECHYEDKVIENAHNLISCLMSDFRCFADENKAPAARLHRITGYIYENFTRKLTLGEIAKRERLSIFYLSHAIKASTGISFQELLNFIRVEESEKLLLGTNKKIGAISGECGFSAVRYYVKHFEKWYNMSPTEYRNKYTGKASSREAKADYSRCDPPDVSESRYEPRIFIVDVTRGLADNEWKNEFPEEIFNVEVMKAVGRPFNLFKSLNEKLLFSNRSCMVSTSAENTADVSNLSIFVYNCGEELYTRLLEPMVKENFLEKIRAYDDESEFIIRCTGIWGGFRIVRYKMTKQNVIGAYDEWTKSAGTLNKRQALVNSWSSLPNIEVGEVTVSDTLNLRVRLKGLSAELILIDKK